MKMLYSHDKRELVRNYPNGCLPFYIDNKKRIETIIDLLADDESKRVYRGMTSFRATMDYSFHPGKAKQPQYFVEDIVKTNNKETFVDAGGYDGNTSADFCEYVGGEYDSVVILEPDAKCAELIEHNDRLMRRNNIKLIKKGAWDCDTELRFNASGNSASHITDNHGEEGTVVIPVTAIDNIEECRKASFIKMDVEGAEMNALKGAENTILHNKPKLAICLYHSDDDMLDIIEYLHRLVPEYRIYVRQHSAGRSETVAYFVL